MAISSTESVRSLERGLRLLQIMNRDPQASVTKLARETGIPRSTAYRLLDTMSTLGLVANVAGGGYRLTREIRSLSDGFIDEGWIDPAWKEMVRLSRTLIWPISLFTHEAGTMVIRRTTHELSTMSIDYGMSGRRMPVTETAAGRAYLAFCPEAERELILSMPSAYLHAPSRVERQLLEDRLRQIRERGFDTRVGGVVERTGSLAVPVVLGERVLCSLSLIFILAGMTAERAIAEFEAPMKEGARRIADAAVRLSDMADRELAVQDR